jgi:hypothetical protein
MRVWHFLYLVLAALAALSAAEQSSGVGSAYVHDLFIVEAAVEASIRGRMTFADQPKGPGNRARRTGLGSAANQPVTSETEPPYGRVGSTDDAVSNLSA